MLDLQSPRWAELRHAYGSAEDVPEMLRRIQLSWDKKAWFDVWSALCHQSDVHTATYAAVPHLVNLLLNEHSLKRRADIYNFVCYSYSCSVLPQAAPCPTDLRPAYDKALKHAEEFLLQDLKLKWPLLNLRYAVSGLLSLRGDFAGSRLLDAYDAVDEEMLEFIKPFKFSSETFPEDVI